MCIRDSASPVHVLAETADEQGRGYGRLLEWRDSAGRVRQWAMPVRSLVPRNGEGGGAGENREMYESTRHY
ncbi:DUF927 domain-containing protein, partial [Aeromonas salmonicida]|uniref:DUF927 domain-containing protein n=1 Tax=Aeromonas salmonicida TaxID=645 RepID=UPI003D31D231